MDHGADPEPACTNGHSLEEYNPQFRQATRIGINFRGAVEYANVEEGIVYEIVYKVGSNRIDWIRQHDMLRESVDGHIEASEERFGEWREIEGV